MGVLGIIGRGGLFRLACVFGWAVLGLVVSGCGPDGDPKQARAAPPEVQAALAERLGLPVLIKDKFGIEFVLIPGGQYKLGPPSGPGIDYADLSSQATGYVRSIRPFYLQVTELTGKHMRAILREMPHLADDFPGTDEPLTGYLTHSVIDVLRQQPFRSGGRCYRLPTEFEWEVAARAGRSGDEIRRAIEARLLSAHEAQPPGLSPAASPALNPWGLRGMLGNVREVTSSVLAPIEADVGDTAEHIAHLSLLREWLPRAVRGAMQPGRVSLGDLWRRTSLYSRDRAVDVGCRLALDIPPPAMHAWLSRSSDQWASMRIETLDANTGEAVDSNVAVSVLGVSQPAGSRGLIRVPRATVSFDPVVLFHPAQPESDHSLWRASPHWAPPAVTRIVRFPLFQTVELQGSVTFDNSDGRSLEGTVWIEGMGKRGDLRPYVHPEIPLKRAQSARDGTFRIRGVPWAAGVPLRLRAISTDSGNWEGRASIVLPLEYEPVLQASVRVRARSGGQRMGTSPEPDGGYEACLSAVLLTERPDSSVDDESARNRLSVSVRGEGHRTARGLVLLQLHGGMGVRGPAWLHSGSHVEFRDLPVGSHRATFLSLGHAPTTVDFSVSAASEDDRRVEIQVQQRAQIEVEVRRASGEPAAWARIRIASRDPMWSWVPQRRGGWLDADPKVGADGRGNFTEVPAGRVYVTATWWGYTATEPVLLEPGATGRVVLTLPR